MKRPRIRTLLGLALAAFAVFYLAGVIVVATNVRTVAPLDGPPEPHPVIAIFGASGTAGDGILQAALADPGIRRIHVVTRRATPRIEAGVAAGKVVMTLHTDYLDYADLREQIAEADTVYWAIGISSLGVDEETYGRIHVDFPLQFVREWTSVHHGADLSFHFISSSDISEDSRAMWAREKVRAEKTLIGFAEGTDLRVIAYRPDYIGPTEEEAHVGQRLLYGFFRPVGAAVKATEIGRAMLELTARGPGIANGTRVGTAGIVRYSEAYERRRTRVTPEP